MSLSASQIRDGSLREAYRKVTAAGSASGRTITARELATLIRSTFDGKGISATEERDLRRILRDARLTDKARRELDEFLDRRDQMDDKGLFPMTDSQTRQVIQTIRASFHTGQISFRDPVQMYPYRPHMYTDVARLIEAGFITCYWHDAGADEDARSYNGLYNNVANRLVIAVSKRVGVERESTMVHEATHAIQDLADMRMRRHDAEAAAHLAQAVMLIERGRGSARLLYDRLTNIEAQARKVLARQPITVADWRTIISAIRAAYPTNPSRDYGRDGGGAGHFYEELVKWLYNVTW